MGCPNLGVNRVSTLSHALSVFVPILVRTSERIESMRYLLAALSFAAVLYGNVSAQAEKRIFIIANNPDGYGVDRCLATGASCGAAVATAYCRSRDFAQAASFRKVDRDEITGAVPTPSACRGGSCGEFVAIECSR